MSDTTEDEKLMSEIGYVKVVVQKDHRSVTKYRHPEYNDVSVWLAKALTAHIAQKQLQAKKDLLAEVREKMPEEYDDYYATDPVRKGHKMGYNEAIHEVLAAIKEIEEGL